MALRKTDKITRHKWKKEPSNVSTDKVRKEYQKFLREHGETIHPFRAWKKEEKE